MILWGHTVLEMNSQRGYTSDWATKNFSSRLHRNRFFARLGESTPPNKELIDKINQKSTMALLQEFG